MFIVLVIISMAVVESALVNDYNEVDTSSGRVRGQRKQFRGTSEDIDPESYIFTYLGIPYAKPPLGDLRFKKPEPAEAWKETLFANTIPPACVQHSSYPYPWFDQEPGQSEDCLYLNIYQPKLVGAEPRPVIFAIHGGYFLGGSSRMKYYNGEYYAVDRLGNQTVQGALVVTINYRLGAFGFLTTTDAKEVPGNVAMYDMILALEWVKKNAAAFNGDPDTITLYGTGSGSVAASLLCVSPLTEGLFSRAILYSGTFVSTKENKFEDNLRLSGRLAAAVNCSASPEDFRSNPKDAITCLQGVDANNLAKTLNSLNPGALSLFYPHYDGYVLPSDPLKYLKDGSFRNVAILLGLSSTEGSLILTNRYPEEFGRFGEKSPCYINKTFATDIIKDAFKAYPDPNKFAVYYMSFLANDRKVTFLTRTMIAIGDESVYCPAVYFAEMYGDKYGSTSEVYVVEYSLHPHDMPWAKWMESVHFNDGPYFLDTILDGKYDDWHIYQYDEFQEGAGLVLRSYNLEFARYGTLKNDGWDKQKFGKKNHVHYQLGDTKETFKVDIEYFMHNCDFIHDF